MAALRRTADDLINMENALAEYSDKVVRGEDALQEDLLFHLAIAKASGNPTLNTFMLKITPEIINNFLKSIMCVIRILLLKVFKNIKQLLMQFETKILRLQKVQ